MCGILGFIGGEIPSNDRINASMSKSIIGGLTIVNFHY